MTSSLHFFTLCCFMLYRTITVNVDYTVSPSKGYSFGSNYLDKDSPLQFWYWFNEIPLNKIKLSSKHPSLQSCPCSVSAQPLQPQMRRIQKQLIKLSWFLLFTWETRDKCQKKTNWLKVRSLFCLDGSFRRKQTKTNHLDRIYSQSYTNGHVIT